MQVKSRLTQKPENGLRDVCFFPIPALKRFFYVAYGTSYPPQALCKMSDRVARFMALFLLWFTGINALVAGTLFIYDPSGRLMGMHTGLLKVSPFTTFLIPGLVLFTVNGVFNLVVGILAWQEHPRYPALTLSQGILLGGWIFVQVFILQDFNTLHFIMLLIALAMIGTGISLNTTQKGG